MQIEDKKTEAQPRLDLDAIRAKLAGQTGRRYWRSLEEVADTPEFQLWLEDEFPNRRDLAQIDRRSLLKFMGASIALAGLAGCRGVFLPQDKVVPYVRQPEELVPGKPLYYASALTRGGYATGVLVEQHEGRPTKIEGNPQHPASLGASDSMTQAEILNLYDPDRSDAPVFMGDVSTWAIWESALLNQLAKETETRGAGLRILTGAVTSPTQAALMGELLAKYPGARWHSYEPAGRTNEHEGARMAFGRPVDTVYNFTDAAVVVTLDGDFLSPAEFPGALTYARQFMNGRRVHGKSGKMNRLYSFESTPGLVGGVADHRWRAKPTEMSSIAAALLSVLEGGSVGSLPGGMAETTLRAVVEDMGSNKGRVVVVAGKHLPAEVHAIVQRINLLLGGFGKTVSHIAPVEESRSGNVGTISELVADLNGGTVSTLLVLDSNPVYTAPADLGFAEALKKAGLKVHAGLYRDETAELCDWHLPLTHGLEAWGDARAFDGTVSIVQPLIAPLYEGRSAIEILAKMVGRPVMGYDLVRDNWRRSGLGGADFEKFWRRALHEGVVANSARRPVTLTSTAPAPAPVAATGKGLEIVFRPDPMVYDGSYSNNGWLQETPKPLTNLTWDNAVMVSPKTARDLGLNSEDRVILRSGTVQVDAAVWIQPGHADGVVTAHLGYGRTAGGTVATVKDHDGGGFNAYRLRTSAGMGFATGVELVKGEGLYTLASTQGASPLVDSRIEDDRDIIRDFTLNDFNEHIDEWQETWQEKSREYNENNLYPDEIFESDSAQWGMTIDMNTCIGCGACVTACVAENNVAVVGKIQTKRHRNLHWIRIDRYYGGEGEQGMDNPTVTFQPLMCVHCEKAPCEPVCPVAATVHSHEGLNMMVYNRCVGTRYCSNNCPYKVRKFNYLNYSDNQPNFANKEMELVNVPVIKQVPGPIHSPKDKGIELLRLVNNPDVTVRGRGVMEKCTYCVQRINDARIEAKKAGKTIADGEVVTACQQACPTNTIVFGNIADPRSRVSELRKDPRAYLLLEELLTRPRTSHLAKLRNPNPAIPTTKTEVAA